MEPNTPSPRVRELIRQGAHIVASAPDTWLEELNEATIGADPMVAEDPDLAAATIRSNLANIMQWAVANVQDPGAPVPPNVGPELLGIVRDVVRRGLDTGALDAYRVGQNVAWRQWMNIAFKLTSDPDELRELLDVTSRSMSDFVDATLEEIRAHIEQERDELTHGTHAERREVVTLILDGAPIARHRAETRLGYALDRPHTAAVIWGDDPGGDLSQLDRAAEAFARAAGVERPLSVIPSAATRWVWVPGPADVDRAELDGVVDASPQVRIAVGSTGSGMEGFRRSHLDALTTQRMLARLRSRQRVAFFTDVELVALLTQDSDRADEFINRALGDFRHASADLHAAVLTFVNAQCNASRAAAILYTHRNTLLRKLARADELLPRPLQENSVHVAVALEALRWRGSDT